MYSIAFPQIFDGSTVRLVKDADAMMKELIKDEVYEAVLSYMPQTTIDRDNILVESVGNYVRVSIRAENDLGVVSDLMEITLLKSDEQA